MDKFKKMNRKFALILITTCLSIFLVGNGLNIFQGLFSQKLNAAEIIKDPVGFVDSMPMDIKLSVDKVFMSTHEWPTVIDTGKRKVKVEYNFNPELDSYIKKLLKSYRSDYSTVTVIDNETGNVLAAIGHEGKSNNFDSNLILMNPLTDA